MTTSPGSALGPLRAAATLLAVVALAGIVVDGLANGLSFAVMVRWVGGAALALVVAALLLTAYRALRGARPRT